MHFLPVSWQFNQITLLGLILLLGVVGGEIFRFTKILPTISGYLAVGYLIGPRGFDVINNTLLSDTQVFIDVTLGLILFSLGRHLDFIWLRKDRSLLLMSIAESSLTFFATFIILIKFKVTMFFAAITSAIAVTTSPMVVMMVAHDLVAKGPVTRRALMLTSLNNLFGLMVFNIFLPFTSNLTVLTKTQTLLHATYLIFGSVFLSVIMFILMMGAALLIGKSKANQFILFIAIIALAIGLAYATKLSTMLTLFFLGVSARNFDFKSVLMEVDFGWLARLFYILLFVVAGVHLRLSGLWQSTIIVCVILFIRIVAKSCGIFILSSASKITKKQALALSFALMPMAGVALGMSNSLVDFDPDFGYQLMTIVMAVIAILNIIGPILVQIAFIMTGETSPNN